MGLNGKEVVENFYTSNFYKDAKALNEYLHPEVELYWNSSAGFSKMKLTDINKMSTEMATSYESLRADISHIIQEDNTVSIRFTYYVTTIESPDEDLVMGHFIAIWELKDGKMYKGHQISQPGDDTPENLASFLTSNF